MMRLIRKSIIRKLFVELFIFVLVMGGGSYYYFFYKGEKTVPYWIFIGVLGLFFVYFLILYWVDIVSPIKKVIGEMQALLANKPYRRIFTKRIDEVGVMTHFFNQVTEGLGKVSHDIKDRERMLDELTIASQLQRDILPLENKEIEGLQVVAKNKAASEVGGDSFNIFQVKSKFYIYIGDVTGHGVAGGLIMTMVNSLVNVFAEMYNNPYDVIVWVNKYIKKYIKKAMFMTMVLLCWDIEKKKLTYVGAGHEHILVYRSATGECEAILSGGVALGMVPDNSNIVAEKEIELDDGDFVILYTDGITEAKNSQGELFGLENLINIVKEYAPQYSAEGVNYHIARDVSVFMKGAPQLDDMTLIVIQRSEDKKKEEIKDKSTNW